MRTKVINNTITRLLNFEKYSNFKQALEDTAIVNDFQVVLLSEDFNPLIIVETRHQITIEEAIRVGRDLASGVGDSYRFVEIGGTKYRPVKSGETPTHVLKVGSKDAYADNHKYKKTVVKGTVLDSSEEINQGAFVDANGLVRFDGLGAGTYTITETVTPDGYNTIDPITVTVTYLDPDREGAGTYRFDVTGGGATYEDNTIKVKIINKKGQKLPETGGMGTTILYIGGSILVLAAAILLVTKRRMNANND